MSERKIVCLSCGSESESFLTDCPNCGGNQYRSAAAVSESADREEEIEARIARLSRSVNPLVPA